MSDTKVRPMNVPSELLASSDYASIESDDGAVVAYTNRRGLHRQHVFVSAPTMVFVQSGTKHLGYGEERVTVSPGQVALPGRGLHLMTEVVEDAQPYRSILVSVREALVRRLAERHDLRGRTSQDAPGFEVIDAERYLHAFFSQLPSLAESAPDPRILAMRVEEAFVAMQSIPGLQFWKTAARDLESDPDARFRELVERHGGTALALEELAVLSGRSLSSFKRDFQRLFGQTPGQWLRQRRLRAASELLRRQGINVTEVSLRLGFASASSFIRAFQREYDATPKQYQLRQAAD